MMACWQAIYKIILLDMARVVGSTTPTRPIFVLLLFVACDAYLIRLSPYQGIILTRLIQDLAASSQTVIEIVIVFLATDSISLS
jgi:hypothetical protein